MKPLRVEVVIHATEKVLKEVSISRLAHIPGCKEWDEAINYKIDEENIDRHMDSFCSLVLEFMLTRQELVNISYQSCKEYDELGIALCKIESILDCIIVVFLANGFYMLTVTTILFLEINCVKSGRILV